MTKREFVDLLRSGGYDAEYNDGRVVVKSNDKTTFRHVETIAKVTGYEGQFEWKDTTSMEWLHDK